MEKKILKSLKPFISFTWREAVIIIFGWLLATVVTMLRPRIISELTDFGLVKGKFNIIVIWAFALLGLSLLQYGNEFLQTSMFTKLSNRFIQNLYEGTFKKITHAPLGVLQGRNQAEILNSISTDISKISWLMDRNSLTMINYLFQIIGGIIGLFWLDYRMAIVVLIIVPIKQTVVMCMAKRKRKMSAIYLKSQQQFSAWFGNQVGGVAEIKLWNLYARKEEQFQKEYSELPRLTYKMNMWDEIETTTGRFIALALELVIYLGCGYLVCQGQMSIGNIFAFLTYATYVSGPLGVFTQIPYIWANIRPSAERFVELIEQPDEKLLGNVISQSEGENSFLELENVSFRYPTGERVLENVSLLVKKGEKIAIIGENGSGKTTLINLLLGLFPVESGSIKIKGKEIGEIGLAEWRNQFALVSQRPYLFEGTVAENIDLSGKVTAKEIEEMAEQFGLDSAIGKFKKGLYTHVQSGGDNLSGGERQKIAYLRSLIKEAEILVLDEATANCDKESRKTFREQIFNQFSQKTVVIISHYIEEIAQADRIYEIKNHTLSEVTGYDFAKERNDF